MSNAQLTDIRLEHATATDEHDASVEPARRWYEVTYFAEDPAGT